MVLLRGIVLPEEFFYDGQLIQRIAQGRATADPSYTNTATFYAVLGLANDETLASFAGYGLGVTALIVTWARCRKYSLGWLTVGVAMLTAFFSGVYLGYYSKDVLVVPIVLAILLLPKGRLSWLVILALIVVYATQFRTYWYIVAILYVAYWLLRRKMPWWALLLSGLLFTVVASLVMSAALGVDPTHFRTMVNDARIGRDVGTRIEPFVALPEPIGGAINNALTFVTLMIPIPLLGAGTLYYAVIFALIAYIWLLFWRSARSLPIAATHDHVYHRAVPFIVALLSTQALFEPDYGSALRHLTPLLPLFVYVTWRATAAASDRSKNYAAISKG